ncbi:MAG: uroporphyrinogen decarboxylase family protein [Armatimonadota bacterium]
MLQISAGGFIKIERFDMKGEANAGGLVKDFEAHNAEVKEVWDAYRRREPVRVPVVFGMNVRYTMFRRETNPAGVTFQQYMEDPQVMLEYQLYHQWWVRHNVPQDAEMGPPRDGWHVGVDFQNTYEAAWLGCPLRFYPNQVPDTEPILKDEDSKRMLFDRGIPDPFEGGLMKRNWEFYDYFKQKQAEGFTYQGLPIVGVSPTGLGTDGPVTVACNIRGATQFFTDLLADTEYALQLLDFITEAIILRIKAYRRRLGQPLKTQGWGFADDSIQLISTELYQKLVFPFHKRLVEAFSEGGPNSVHLCGDATRHFLFMRDNLNIQSFDTGYPVDFAWLRRALGPDVEILGGPSVVFLASASPSEVRREVKRILSSGIMEGGRFILREGNNMPPDVPLENIAAVYEAGKEFGRYSR